MAVTGQNLRQNHLTPFKKFRQSVAGPSSYAAGGFTVNVKDARGVEIALVDCIGTLLTSPTVEYSAQIEPNPSGNTVRIICYGSPSTGSTFIEVANGTNLSGCRFEITAYGY